MLREHLCADQARWGDEWPQSVNELVQVLIDKIDWHRPLGSNGRHGGLHTATCGCEDT
jgi:hypothetical protein